MVLQNFSDFIFICQFLSFFRWNEQTGSLNGLGLSKLIIYCVHVMDDYKEKLQVKYLLDLYVNLHSILLQKLIG